MILFCYVLIKLCQFLANHDWPKLFSSALKTYFFHLPFLFTLLILFGLLSTLLMPYLRPLRHLYTPDVFRGLKFRIEHIISTTGIDCCNSTCHASSEYLNFSYFPLSQISKWLRKNSGVARFLTHKSLGQVTRLLQSWLLSRGAGII